MSIIKSDHKHFIEQHLGQIPYHLQSLAGDASLRTYHRITTGQENYILMLSPQDEAFTSFIDIARVWVNKGICVPKVFAASNKLGAAILSDLGDVLLLSQLNDSTVDGLYDEAINGIIQIQKQDDYVYPPYDNAFVSFELNLFKDWFVEKLLTQTIKPATHKMLDEVWFNLINTFTSGPQTIVHRDYHSRNLMILPDNQIAIIDFQDGMRGPMVYDFVSLIKDCYIKWDRSKREQWTYNFFNKLQTQNAINMHFTDFTRYVDWVGLQRHIKVLGIFSRLKLRDNKWQYIEHIPRIIEYVREVTQQYSQFFTFNQWLENDIFPAFDEYYQKHLQDYQSIKVA